MRFINHKFWIGTLSTTAVFLLVLKDIERTSPGPLTQVHSRVIDLSDRNSCKECHGGWLESMSEACLECHETIGEQRTEEFGLHGHLQDESAEQCSTCHSEHHGAEFPIVNERSFIMTGFGTRDAFDHSAIGFPMAGAHLELDCAVCHDNAHVAFLLEDTTRFGGLDQDCATCHEDPHEGRMLRDCSSCHGQDTFESPTAFVHDVDFPLMGSHALDCRSCHAEGDAHALEVLVAATGKPAWRECIDCHDAPHTEQFLAGNAQLAAMPAGDTCSQCHDILHNSFNEPGLEIGPDQHALSGFDLDAPHDLVSCEDCHATHADTLFEDRFPGRSRQGCAACHEDPHGGQFEGREIGGEGCIACHDVNQFEPHAVGFETHARTALPLFDTHRELDCNECHELSEDAEIRAFVGTPSTCAECHRDGHDDFFQLPEQLGEAQAQLFESDRCATCHEATSFDDVPADRFDHGLWTGFELRGAHAQSECNICHPVADVPSDAGRTFGVVRDHFGQVEGCVTCHNSPHQDSFDRADLPQQLEGRSDCARCHQETSFRDFREDFDHGLWTGYPLTGAHKKAACSSCHATLHPPLEDGRSWERAQGRECNDCHAEPHAGQFKREGKTDCRRCHKSATRFSKLVFDHDQDSSFPLDEAHVSLSCDACHTPWQVSEDVFVVQYRPLGSECTDCHGVVEGQSLQGGGDGR